MSDAWVVPIGRRFLIHSQQAQVSALVNRTAVDCLSQAMRGQTDGAHGVPEQIFAQLAEDLSAPLSEPKSGNGHDGISKLVFVPTRACNLLCRYCDFDSNAPSAATLTSEVACRALDFAVEKQLQNGQKLLVIHFFGGEPLLAREFVDELVHYARAVCASSGIKPLFEVTTNGVIDDRYLSFVGDYFDRVVVSFDGSRLFQDHYRPLANGGGSFDAVDHAIRSLSRYPTDLSLRLCATSETVVDLQEIVRRVCSDYDIDHLDIEPLCSNPSSDAAGLKTPDPCDFAREFLAAAKIASSSGVQLHYGPAAIGEAIVSCCPVGTDALVVMPDNSISACYLPPDRWQGVGLDFSLGYVSTESGVHLLPGAQIRVRKTVLSKPRCERCFCRWSCAGGCHVTQTPPGGSLSYTSACIQTRIITAGMLLWSLEGPESMAEWLHDHEAMQALALHCDDRLSSWGVSS